MREAQTNETSAAAVRVGHRSELRSLARVLSHPLLILLVGAAMSALVVPMLTNRWQEHQRALDIQTALVSDLSATATEFLFKLETLDEEVRFRPSRAVSASLATVNNRWQVNRAVIAAKLGAYYGETAIPAEWDDLSRVLSTLCLVDWSLSQQVAARQGRQPSPRGIPHNSKPGIAA